MSDLAQMEDNLSFMKGFTGLSDAERQTLEEARRELAHIPLIPCTTCNYCAKVCPVEVGISGTTTTLVSATILVGTTTLREFETGMPAAVQS